jgi:hypothetical protein
MSFQTGVKTISSSPNPNPKVQRSITTELLDHVDSTQRDRILKFFQSRPNLNQTRDKSVKKLFTRTGHVIKDACWQLYPSSAILYLPKSYPEVHNDYLSF